MNTFTPGPWRIIAEDGEHPYIRIRGTQLGCRYKIANVLTPIYDGSEIYEIYETRSNAALIAAAPELLESLTAISHMLWSRPDVVQKLRPLMGFAEANLFTNAEAAITMARGPSQADILTDLLKKAEGKP